MPWIPIIPQESADELLREAYRMVSAVRGRVANILAVHSVHPAVMTAHLQLYRELMFGPSQLTRAERETMAVAVSAANKCRY